MSLLLLRKALCDKASSLCALPCLYICWCHSGECSSNMHDVCSVFIYSCKVTQHSLQPERHMTTGQVSRVGRKGVHERCLHRHVYFLMNGAMHYTSRRQTGHAGIDPIPVDSIFGLIRSLLISAAVRQFQTADVSTADLWLNEPICIEPM